MWGLRTIQVICRDIWALHLDTLPSSPPPEPILHAEDLAGGPSHRSRSRARDSAHVNEEAEKDDTDKEDSDEEDELKPSSAQSSSNSNSLSEDEEKEKSKRNKSAPPIAELDAALAELSERSSSSSGEEDELAGPPSIQAAYAKKRRHTGLGPREGPLSTLVVLLLACWFLRLPIMYKDIIRLVEQYKIPWLESVREIPTSMRRHLSKWAVAALTPAVRLHRAFDTSFWLYSTHTLVQHPPTVHKLHNYTGRLARALSARYGIVVPEINAGPLLWRTVRALGGTRE